MVFEIHTQKKLTQSGGSLVINITKECQNLGLGRGDLVNVTLSRSEDDADKWLGDYLGWSMYMAPDGSFYACGPKFDDVIDGKNVLDLQDQITRLVQD